MFNRLIMAYFTGVDSGFRRSPGSELLVDGVPFHANYITSIGKPSETD